MKNQKNIIAGAIAIVGIVLVISYFAKNKAKVKTKPQVKKAIPPKIPAYAFPLQKGSKGAYVSQLQSYILQLDSTLLPKFKEDGKYGNETEAAVEKLLGKKTINSQADVEAMNK